ncbi:15242_t:CDS:1, partial [Funneliformis mosseae]
FTFLPENLLLARDNRFTRRVENDYVLSQNIFIVVYITDRCLD